MCRQKTKLRCPTEVRALAVAGCVQSRRRNGTADDVRASLSTGTPSRCCGSASHARCIGARQKPTRRVGGPTTDVSDVRVGVLSGGRSVVYRRLTVTEARCPSPPRGRRKSASSSSSLATSMTSHARAPTDDRSTATGRSVPVH